MFKQNIKTQLQRLSIVLNKIVKYINEKNLLC